MKCCINVDCTSECHYLLLGGVVAKELCVFVLAVYEKALAQIIVNDEFEDCMQRNYLLC